MKNKTIQQLLQFMSNNDHIRYQNLNELIEIQQELYSEIFQQMSTSKDEVILSFQSANDAQAFYLDCHYGYRYLKTTGIYYHLSDPTKLVLKPVSNVASLINSKQPGLLEISKLLGINFGLKYIQNYTNNTIKLYCVDGQIFDIQCDIHIFTTLPWLSCGKLYQLFSNQHDFEKLNPTIHYVKGEMIFESNINRA